MPISQIPFEQVAPIRLPDLMAKFAEGEKARALPEQLRQEQQARALRNAILEAQAKYEPGTLSEKLKTSQLETMKQKANLARMQAFQNILSQRGRVQSGVGQFRVGQPGISPGAAIPSQTRAPADAGIPQQDLQLYPRDLVQEQLAPSRPRAPGQDIDPSVLPSSYEGYPPMHAHGEQTIVLHEGDPRLHHLDEIYKNYPQYRDLMQGQGIKGSSSVKQSPETGQVFMETQLPSGRIEEHVMYAGRTPEDIAQAKERGAGLGKADASMYQSGVEQLGNLSDQKDNLNYIVDLLQRNPHASNVIGPYNNWATRLAGSQQDKELLGQFATSTGNITLQAAKGIKGAFTGRDQGLINSLKPTTKDPYGVFLGKTKAMLMLNEFVSRRINKINQYIHNGMSSSDAIQKARNEISLDKIRPQIQRMVEGGVQDSALNSNLMIPPSVQTKDSFIDHFSSLSPEQQRRLLSRTKER